MPPIFPASSKQSGQAFAVPDTCLTPAPPAPPVPTPYPNIAMLMQAVKFSTKVKLSGMAALNIQSEVPMTQGDEAGVNGGVMSGVNMNKMVFKRGSAKVKVEGAAMVFLTSTTGHNGANANMPTGTQIAPSQTMVIAN